jgi:hypothetical protein
VELGTAKLMPEMGVSMGAPAFYQATVNTPAMVLKMPGVGSQYTETAADGTYLDRAKNYRLHVPANVPAKDFWSVVLHDP